MRRATRTRRPPRRNRLISIHALHEESDFDHATLNEDGIFQSTLSMRRATLFAHGTPKIKDISIHALHEESDRPKRSAGPLESVISIHALHEESDFSDAVDRIAAKFQSTLSMRRATQHADHHRGRDQTISIHALHEESDSAAGHFCPLFETQASCLALSISNNTADTTNNMSKTSNWLSVSF